MANEIEDLYPDLDIFISIFGERPILQTFEGRIKKQQYADRLDDWGGVLDKDFPIVTAEFEKYGMTGITYWINVNASPRHGKEWIYIKESDTSGPIPKSALIGHAVARHQYKAYVLGEGFTMKEVHPFNRKLISAEVG